GRHHLDHYLKLTPTMTILRLVAVLLLVVCGVKSQYYSYQDCHCNQDYLPVTYLPTGLSGRKAIETSISSSTEDMTTSDASTSTLNTTTPSTGTDESGASTYVSPTHTRESTSETSISDIPTSTGQPTYTSSSVDVVPTTAEIPTSTATSNPTDTNAARRWSVKKRHRLDYYLKLDSTMTVLRLVAVLLLVVCGVKSQYNSNKDCYYNYDYLVGRHLNDTLYLLPADYIVNTQKYNSTGFKYGDIYSGNLSSSNKEKCSQGCFIEGYTSGHEGKVMSWNDVYNQCWNMPPVSEGIREASYLPQNLNTTSFLDWFPGGPPTGLTSDNITADSIYSSKYNSNNQRCYTSYSGIRWFTSYPSTNTWTWYLLPANYIVNTSTCNKKDLYYGDPYPSELLTSDKEKCFPKCLIGGYTSGDSVEFMTADQLFDRCFDIDNVWLHDPRNYVPGCIDNSSLSKWFPKGLPKGLPGRDGIETSISSSTEDMTTSDLSTSTLNTITPSTGTDESGASTYVSPTHTGESTSETSISDTPTSTEYYTPTSSSVDVVPTTAEIPTSTATSNPTDTNAARRWSVKKRYKNSTV
ncbi:unnamed protein product, partial [Sphagnum troendelagicum]